MWQNPVLYRDCCFFFFKNWRASKLEIRILTWILKLILYLKHCSPNTQEHAQVKAHDLSSEETWLTPAEAEGVALSDNEARAA